MNCVVQVECCLISTEAKRTIRDGEPGVDTLTFIQVQSSENCVKKQQTHPNNKYVKKKEEEKKGEKKRRLSFWYYYFK